MASDSGRKERLRAIRQLLYGSDSEDEGKASLNVSVNGKVATQKKRGRSKKSRWTDTIKPGPASQCPEPELETVQEPNIDFGSRGTILLHSETEVPWGVAHRRGARADEYEDDYEEEYEDQEFEMFGTEEEGEYAYAPEDEDGEGDEDSSDSEIEFGLRKAIGIEDDDIANYNMAEDPMNGSQFLLRAMQESKNLPKVAVADPELLRVKLATGAAAGNSSRLPPRYEEAVSGSGAKKQQRQRKRRKRKSTSGEADADTEMGVGENTAEVPMAEAVAVAVPGEGESSGDPEDEEEEQDIQTTTNIANLPAPPETASAFDPSPFLPSPEWQAEVLTEFTRLRAKVERRRPWAEQNKLGLAAIVGYNVELPDGRIESWFRFCFGGRLEYDVKCGKFQKPAPKVTAGLSVEEFCRGYLDQFFSRTGRVVDLQQQVQASDAELAASVSSISLEDEEESAKQVQAPRPTAIFASNPNRKPQLVPYDGHKPLLSIVLHIPQRVLEALIEYNLNWLTENYGQFINAQHCEWLYSLLVCLQLPLEGGVVSNLRDIARACKKQRGLLAQIVTGVGRIPEKDQSQEDEESIRQYLNSLNLFITLVGNYFGQKDLLDGF